MSTKMIGKPRILSLSPTRLIISIKHELLVRSSLCKIDNPNRVARTCTYNLVIYVNNKTEASIRAASNSLLEKCLYYIDLHI